MSMLPVKRAAEITESPPQQWLVESLWTQQAVGVLCAQPKSGKSWLAQDFAVSVASGTPVLDRFAVPDKGSAGLVTKPVPMSVTQSEPDRARCARSRVLD